MKEQLGGGIAKSLRQNAVDGSSSNENGKKEVSFFCAEYELIRN